MLGAAPARTADVQGAVPAAYLRVRLRRPVALEISPSSALSKRRTRSGMTSATRCPSSVSGNVRPRSRQGIIEVPFVPARPLTPHLGERWFPTFVAASGPSPLAARGQILVGAYIAGLRRGGRLCRGCSDSDVVPRSRVGRTIRAARYRTTSGNICGPQRAIADGQRPIEPKPAVLTTRLRVARSAVR